MTKEQLKTLATLPKVLDALRALVRESDGLRELLNRVNAGPTHVTLPAGAALESIGPIIPYDGGTPPSPEYIAAELKRRGLARKPKTLAELPAAQRKAIQNGLLNAQDPARLAKLEQFKHDGEPPSDAEERTSNAAREDIDTLSEAS